MTWEATPRRVLVTVETADCLAALRLSADEARRRHCGGHLLHVLPPVYASHPHIEELSAIAAEQRRAGTEILKSAADALRSLADGLEISTELCHGAVVPMLVESSARACLLVLQHQDRGRDRPRLLSVTRAVVASAQCPVLAVPATWSGTSSARLRGGQPVRPLVVAGVVDAVRSARVVDTALTEASRRHARLLIVHGLRGGELATVRQPLAETLLRSMQHGLEADLADLYARHHDVAVELEVVPEPPGQAIASRCHDADLVVVGRGERWLPFPARPGPVADDVLHHVDVPVLVVDDAAGTRGRHEPRRLVAF